MRVRCPSGLTGEVRKLKVTEFDVLADRKAAKKGETFDKILSACWVETSDSGPYAFEDGVVDWARVLLCDRYYALAAIRVATYGPKYVFPYRCPSCEDGGEWEIDITEDLSIYDLPEESIEKIRTGDNRFRCEFDGHDVVFKLLNGRDEKRTTRQVRENKGNLISTSIKARIIEIDGKRGETEVGKAVEDIDGDVQLDLLDEFEKVDGGIDQQIEIECEHCDHRFEFRLPFEGEGFWLRSSRSERKRKRSKRLKESGKMARRMDEGI